MRVHGAPHNCPPPGCHQRSACYQRGQPDVEAIGNADRRNDCGIGKRSHEREPRRRDGDDYSHAPEAKAVGADMRSNRHPTAANTIRDPANMTGSPLSALTTYGQSATLTTVRIGRNDETAINVPPVIAAR